MEDGQIIELFFQRSERAISETDARYGGYCYAIANNILCNRQDSEECVSDTYMTVWNSIPPEKPRCFSAYLGKITRNISLDCWRKKHAARRGCGQLVFAIEELDRTSGRLVAMQPGIAALRADAEAILGAAMAALGR